MARENIRPSLFVALHIAVDQTPNQLRKKIIAWYDDFKFDAQEPRWRVTESGLRRPFQKVIEGAGRKKPDMSRVCIRMDAAEIGSLY